MLLRRRLGGLGLPPQVGRQEAIRLGQRVEGRLGEVVFKRCVSLADMERAIRNRAGDYLGYLGIQEGLDNRVVGENKQNW